MHAEIRSLCAHTDCSLRECEMRPAMHTLITQYLVPWTLENIHIRQQWRTRLDEGATKSLTMFSDCHNLKSCNENTGVRRALFWRCFSASRAQKLSVVVMNYEYSFMPSFHASVWFQHLGNSFCTGLCDLSTVSKYSSLIIADCWIVMSLWYRTSSDDSISRSDDGCKFPLASSIGIPSLDLLSRP